VKELKVVELAIVFPPARHQNILKLFAPCCQRPSFVVGLTFFGCMGCSFN